jgi:hypothetical protein
MRLHDLVQLFVEDSGLVETGDGEDADPIGFGIQIFEFTD